MLKNMKIGKRLIISFIAVALIVSISGFAGLTLLIRMDTSYSDALVINGFALGDIGEFNTYLNKGGAITRDVIMLTDPDEIRESQAELEEVAVQTQNALEATKLSCASPEETAILARIDAAFPKYIAARDKAAALGLKNQNEEALRVFHDEARPYLNECMEAGQELMALNREMGDAVSSRLTTESRVGTTIIIAAIIAGLAISILLAVFISRGIARPLGEIEAAAKKMSTGNYDVQITHQAKDEVGSLADSMRQMTSITNAIIQDTSRGLNEVAAGNFDIAPTVEYVGVFGGIESALRKIIIDLSNTMSQIMTSADQVSSGSDQVSSGAQALSQGATEQASSVEELSATISEISDQVAHTARTADEARAKSASSSTEVNSSNQKMQELMRAMEEISSKSNEIGKIIKTIDDIAFQTNILALNAAVEAARAGAAGKGFAVVADEVRNLAGKSADAAKNTAALIEETILAITGGTQMADDTAKSMLSVVEGTSAVTEMIETIASASNEQASSIAQITQGIDQISTVVQVNSATAEESAAASEELSAQAQILNDLVTHFKLKNLSDSAPGA